MREVVIKKCLFLSLKANSALINKPFIRLRPHLSAFKEMVVGSIPTERTISLYRKGF